MVWMVPEVEVIFAFDMALTILTIIGLILFNRSCDKEDKTKMEQDTKMEYKDEDGKVYGIAYSQELQAESIKKQTEAIKLQKAILRLGIVLSVLVVIAIILFIMLLAGGTVTKILHNVVC